MAQSLRSKIIWLRVVNSLALISMVVLIAFFHSQDRTAMYALIIGFLIGTLLRNLPDEWRD